MTRTLLSFVLVLFPHIDALSQPASKLHVAVLETRGFIVGHDNPASGMYRREATQEWTHRGWQNTRNFGIDSHPERPSEIFLACGNGVIRSRDAGESWRIVTDWRVTEVLDVSLDRNQDGLMYIATAHGIWRSRDGGDSWQEASAGLIRPRDTFIQSIEADARQEGHVLAGSEAGLFESFDEGVNWEPVGPRGVAIRDIRQSGADSGVWLAGTEDRGVLISKDLGKTWKFAAGDIADATIYAVAFDPSNSNVMAAAGYDTGLFVSVDGGQSWRRRAGEEKARTIHALRFDATGTLWIGAVGGGMYSTEDLGDSWKHEGLEGAVIYDMIFIGGEHGE